MSIKIFFCYAHEDEALLNRLKKHLKPFQREGLIDTWHDRDITAGAEWEREISEQLNTSQLILLLVSPDFMDSDYCYSVEMKRAIERHKKGEAHVIPIILRHVYWWGEPLGKFQALPTDAKPVTDPEWHNLDIAFLDVAQGIRAVVEELILKINTLSKIPPILIKAESIARYFIEDLEALIRNTNIDLPAYIQQTPGELQLNNRDVLSMLYDDIAHMLRDEVIIGLHVLFSDEQKNDDLNSYPLRYLAKYSFDKIGNNNLEEIKSLKSISGPLAPPENIWCNAHFALTAKWNPIARLDRYLRIRRPSYNFDWQSESPRSQESKPQRELYDGANLRLYREEVVTINQALLFIREEFAYENRDGTIKAWEKCE